MKPLRFFASPFHITAWLFIALLTASANAETVSVQMYFGQTKPGGEAITVEEWEEFEANTLGKAFPGFTVLDAVGYYKHRKDRSKLVIIIMDDADMSRVKEVAEIYKARFKHESVLIVKVPVWAQF